MGPAPWQPQELPDQAHVGQPFQPDRQVGKTDLRVPSRFWRWPWCSGQAPGPPRPSRRRPQGPTGPRHAGSWWPALSSHGRKGSVEIIERRLPKGPTGAHSGAHRGPLWGPFGVGRIIPLGFLEIGRKSAFGARGAHWGPPGAHWGPRPLSLFLGPSGPSTHPGRSPPGHPVK